MITADKEEVRSLVLEVLNQDVPELFNHFGLFDMANRFRLFRHGEWSSARRYIRDVRDSIRKDQPALYWELAKALSAAFDACDSAAAMEAHAAFGKVSAWEASMRTKKIIEQQIKNYETKPEPPRSS